MFSNIPTTFSSSGVAFPAFPAFTLLDDAVDASTSAASAPAFFTSL
jgi:hypothetical protein